MILYSAHGIPQDCIDDGDPYEEQVTKTANAIQDYLKENGFENDFMITYQSKVGPKKWLTPDTESMITQFATQKRPLVIVPLAFTSEHSETLVELDMDYQELALSLGCPDYMRVPAVTDNLHFINGLKEAILSIIDNNIMCNASICSDKFKECPKKKTSTPCITI
jgi:ferrochelatase